MSPTSSEVPVDGGKLAVHRLSDGGGPAVVAVHGITGNGQSWRVVGRALEGQASLQAVDLRGRGQSRDLPGPYGLDVHVSDLLAVLDAEGLGSAVFVGHSLGAYIVARLGALHPDRVRALVLVDGGLRIPGSQVDDPQAFLDAFLGVTLARLALRFATPQEYYDWWYAHPALVDSDVPDDDLKAYADHDLVGHPPELRSSVREDAVRQDGADVLLGEDDAGRLTVPATLLCAPFGLQGEPNPMQPLDLVHRWVDGGPELRTGRQVPNVNHYTIVLGAAGATAVADAVRGVI